MKKNELLKKLGFSDEFLKVFNDHSYNKIKQVDVPILTNKLLDFTIEDTTKLYINKPLKQDSTTLMI